MGGRALLVAGCLLALVAGCGERRDPSRKETVLARGTVKFKGTPAVGARVMFHPVGDPTRPKSHAQVGADGSFELTTYKTGDGAPEGEYDVTVVWTDDLASGERLGPDETDAVPKQDRLGNRYAAAETSGLRRTVKKGSPDLEAIDLK